MRILLAHNYYRDPGGEDDVFASERALLASRGHSVSEYVRRNDEIAEYSVGSKLMLPLRTVWARDSYAELKRLIEKDKPDVVHFHNTFPLISPSAYYACRDAGVPVVQMLHNPRLLCPAATLYRNGEACSDCLGRSFAWPGVVHGCYRESRLQTAAVAAMLAWHQRAGTWHNLVDLYVVFTEFFRRKFVENGFAAEKIAVKPHFLEPDPGARADGKIGDYALYVGRLVPEKGVRTLIEAWTGLGIPLKIRGEGPLQPLVDDLARGNPAVERVPRPTRADYFKLIKGARFLVWPSEINETFGRVAVDAFACSVAVLTARMGANTEIVSEGRTGLGFVAGDAAELRQVATRAWEHPEEMRAIGLRARAEYEAKYTASLNYQWLMRIYERAIAAKGRVALSASA